MSPGSAIGRVAVFGGSGFLGRAVTARLTAAGHGVRVAVRHPGAVEAGGGVEAVAADLRDRGSVARAVDGCGAAVNAVSLYVEAPRRGETFAAIHEAGARTLAEIAAARGLRRLVHVSGIGAEETSPSRYIRARAVGEHLVRDTFPQATVLRPGMMVGPGDAAVTGLARLLRTVPVFPLFGRGRTRLQPVFVGDVAAAVEAALTHEEPPGRTYELGGPDSLDYRALVERVARLAGASPLLVPMPFAAWDLVALAAVLLPNPPVTDAQVALMRRDNVVGAGMPGLADLGVAPTALEAVLALYRL